MSENKKRAASGETGRPRKQDACQRQTDHTPLIECPQISRPDSLSDLAGQINDQHERATRHATSALEHARQAGELLSQAKQQVAHGEWLTWLSASCKVSPRQAQRYLKVANNWPAITKYDAASHLTIDGAIAAVGSKPDLKSEQAWLEALEVLPADRMLLADLGQGFVAVFRSSRHRDAFHWFSVSYVECQLQESKRPLYARGIAVLSRLQRVQLGEFTEVELVDFGIPCAPSTVWMPSSPYFCDEMRLTSSSEATP